MAKTVITTGAQTEARRAREYETIYILRPNVSVEEADRVAKRLTDVVGTLQGKLIKLDSWGWRRLAYPIKGATRGVFIYARYAGFDDLVAELERNLRLLDPVVRFQTVLLNARVNMDEIQVDPAEIDLGPLAPNDLEDDMTMAQRLGLAERQPHPRAEAPAAEQTQKPAAEENEAEAESAKAEDGSAEEASAENASAQSASDGNEQQPEKAETDSESKPAEEKSSEPGEGDAAAAEPSEAEKA